MKLEAEDLQHWKWFQDTADREDLILAVVNTRVCDLVKML
jgi:hypothetical protein